MVQNNYFTELKAKQASFIEAEQNFKFLLEIPLTSDLYKDEFEGLQTFINSYEIYKMATKDLILSLNNVIIYLSDAIVDALLNGDMTKIKVLAEQIEDYKKQINNLEEISYEDLN